MFNLAKYKIFKIQQQLQLTKTKSKNKLKIHK